jgi:hypothetical protein
MDEIVKDFLIESNENLDRLDQQLLKLESDPSSKELLASVFRTIHTIQGSCGFLGLPARGSTGRPFQDWRLAGPAACPRDDPAGRCPNPILRTEELSSG